MTISKKFFVILVFAVVLGIVVFFVRGNEDAWMCKDGEWERQGNPSSLMPSETCDVNDTDSLLEISEFKTTKLGTLVCGDGSVKNISDTRIGYVNSVFVFYERDGSVFDFSEGYIQSARSMFMPKEEVKFKRCIEDKDRVVDMERIKVVFLGRMGDGIEAKEIPFDIKK